MASIKINRIEIQAIEASFNAKRSQMINFTEERCHSNIPEYFYEPLMKLAYKLLFRELTTSEQQLWNSFEMDQIYRLLTGEQEMVPEFRFNFYTVIGGDATAEFIPGQASSSSKTRSNDQDNTSTTGCTGCVTSTKNQDI